MIGKYGDREGGEGLLKGSCRALKPHNFLHGGGEAFCDRAYLTLEVDHQGVGLSATNHLDGATFLLEFKPNSVIKSFWFNIFVSSSFEYNFHFQVFQQYQVPV